MLLLGFLWLWDTIDKPRPVSKGMLTRKVSLQHGAGPVSYYFSGGDVARKIVNDFYQFIGIAGFNDESTIIRFDKGGNLTILSGNSYDWPAGRSDSIKLARNN